MPRGGANPGERRGGRKKGQPNRKTAEMQERIASEGITPLDYMLSVMREPRAPVARRDEMAKAAAPYVHPKLAAIEHTGKDGGPIETKNVSDADRARALAAFLAKTKPK